MGVTEVYVVDILQKRLDKALELGASAVINGKEKDAVREVLALTHGRGCDLVIETSGSELCANQGLEMLVKDGTLVQVGYSGSGYMKLNTSMICDKELNIRSVFRYRHIYPLAIQAVEKGLVNLKGIVTDTFDLDDIQTAMDSSLRNKAEIVKTVIRVAG